MAKALIRMAACGFELNFGNIVIGKMGDVRFALEDWRAEQLGVECEEAEEIPQFFDDLKLVVDMGGAQIYVYPFKKEDIKPLGQMLSSLYPCYFVSVDHKSRMLMAWDRGEVVHEQKTIDHFYDGMSEEEIEYSRF